MSTTIEIIAVCSNRGRPAVQNNHSKGHQWWKREVYHLLAGDGSKPLYHGAQTLCGRDCSDWLTIGPLEKIDDGCCQRCLKLHAPELPS